MSSSSPWTADEDAVLRCSFARGLTAGQTAKKLPGRSRHAVAARARFLHVGRDQLCECPECRAGDALPVRLHGIPHAKQLRFAAVPPPLTIAASNEVEEIKPPLEADPDQLQIGL